MSHLRQRCMWLTQPDALSLSCLSDAAYELVVLWRPGRPRRIVLCVLALLCACLQCVGAMCGRCRTPGSETLKSSVGAEDLEPSLAQLLKNQQSTLRVFS